ncbi:hypothetical protein M569_05638, partial [Genlisea aurea]
EEQDSLLKFIDYSKSILCSDEVHLCEDLCSPSWSWIANRILRTCATYSSGVTPAILLSELAQAWTEKNRSGAPRKQSDWISISNRKRRRAKLVNTVTIDSIYEKKFLSLSGVIEAVIVEAYTLPGTDIRMLSLGDIWSSNTIDLYLHRRFYDIADPCNGVLKKGREVLLTGCYLRVTTGSSGCIRLLPTEHFVILLDEDEDDDAMLLGAQFCSDSFSSISLETVDGGASYSLYARIENIGPVELLGKNGSLQRKQITLVDNDGSRLKFLLWGDQLLIANLLSEGSMLAIDRPFISTSPETCDEVCLEYGSATELYAVPLTLHKEQVRGSRLFGCSNNTSEGRAVHPRVELPRDSTGSIDFSDYVFRCYVADVRDKMCSISLYGVVEDMRASLGGFSIKIGDISGSIWVALHLVGSWSLGRLDVGHTIFISGLSSSLGPDNKVHLSWYENSRPSPSSSSSSTLFDVSCLPALLNSPCLYGLLSLSEISDDDKIIGTKVCRVWVDGIDYGGVETGFVHSPCGRFVGTSEDDSAAEEECTFC